MITLLVMAVVSHYPHYPDRTTTDLSGDWDFYFAGPNVSLDTFNPSKIDFNTTLAVPSAWDAAFGTGLQYNDGRGTGVYRKQLKIDSGSDALVHFEACSLWCRIIIDGKVIAEMNEGGFTPFWVNVPAAKTSTRELVVVADNRFDKERTPTQSKNYDFYQYGGLIRAVTLHQLPKAQYIQRVEVFPLGDASGKPNGKVRAQIVLGRSQPVPLALHWDGAKEAATTITGNPDANNTIEQVLTLPAALALQHWSPAHPTLHTLKVGIASPGEGQGQGGALTGEAQLLDSIEVRFGLRIVGVSEGGRMITINGESTKLRGFNRHDMYPQVGPTVPESIYASDIALLKSLGANFVRGCHYPQDERFLDMCDEQGIMIWNEALAWGNYWQQLTDPAFMKAELATANAMVDAAVNHPSVILWGFFNEGQSENANATASYAAMAHVFKSRDPSRLVTWASNRQDRDKGFEYADVISFNGYPGWYGGGADTVVDSWSKAADWVEQNWPKKPFIISETGAGGILGDHWAPSTCTKGEAGVSYGSWYGGKATLISPSYGSAAACCNLCAKDKGCGCWDLDATNSTCWTNSICGPKIKQAGHTAGLGPSSRWSEEYQEEVFSLDASMINHTNVAGVALWQFSDIKVDATNFSSTSRPGGINNKGVVSRWRQPKLAAASIAAIYNASKE